MYHISVNLAIGRREKIYSGVQKTPGQKGYKVAPKNSVDLFSFFRHLSFCGGVKW